MVSVLNRNKPRAASKSKLYKFNGSFELRRFNLWYIRYFKIENYPAFRTAPVQLNEAAAVPVAFALYGDAMTLSPSSSSDTAVVRLIRSSSEI